MSHAEVNEEFYNSNQLIDLTNCEREPIHIPGSIQSYGLLLVLKMPELTIIQVSSNTLALLGLPPEQLLNQPLELLLEETDIHYLRHCLQNFKLERNPLQIFTIKIKGSAQNFYGIVHLIEGVVVLELELVKLIQTTTTPGLYSQVKATLSQLRVTLTVREFCQSIAEEVQRLTGFDRVMIYRFDEEYNGEVIAEARAAEKVDELTTYLGLHYPASDIPRQARVLYLLNWIRLIANVSYTPVSVIPTLNPVTAQILDMSSTALRSVSPVHIQYLKNMGVKASMSISLLKEDRLWGLIACHHYSSALYVPYETRTACELFGQVLSLQLSTKEDSENYDYRVKLQAVQSKLVQFMSVDEHYLDGLVKHQPNLLDFIEAQGVAICFNKEYLLLGQTPTKLEVRDLVAWLEANKAADRPADVYYTNALSKEYEVAANFKDVASGLLAISISQTFTQYILWFRPEVIQAVDWGGNPNKPVQLAEDGPQLLPRTSFELWKELVQQKSLPWHDYEIKAAHEFREAILGVMLMRQTGDLIRLNQELEQSNIELDAFSYIASHDLKEPLRGIHNYSKMLIEDYAQQLDDEGKEKLHTLARLTQRMEGLLDSLLYFSQVGRLDFSVTEADLNEVVHQALDMLHARIEQEGVEIQIPQPLPAIRCDRVRLSEVYSNLISNAIKYNNKAEKSVEIGYLKPKTSGKPLVFYVKDNGIGIMPEYYETIFMIFKRLHKRDRFGGGTGAGLTITKKIVERHGGKIWVESVYGEGSIFYFTLEESGTYEVSL
ncbi:MAG: ATP-binding protein [Chloroflexota bacterium]|nr:GAF domain-containing protein [Chloroflexota bacterium]